VPDRISLDHVAHAAEHHRDLLPRYAGELGGAYVGHGEAIGFSPMQLRFANDAKVELLRPHDEYRNPFLRRYLDRRGPGLHHATFKVPDIRATIADLEAAGYAVVDVDLSQPDWQEAFVHPKSAHGFLVQIAQVRGEMPERQPPEWFPSASAPAASILRVVLRVASVDAALSLYRDRLGGEVVDGGDDWVDLDHGGGQLVRLQQDTDEGASHLEVAVADPSSVAGAVELPDGRWEVPAVANHGARLVLSRS
jgi:catechol 2,3-dioxygenase-like lactoylglutathione lyase family enzyme